MKNSNFSETLTLWGHLKTRNIFKHFWTYFEPISKGTCRLLGHIKIPNFIFSMHPSRQSVTLNIGLNIGCSHNRDNRPSEQSAKCTIGQAQPETGSDRNLHV